MPLYSSSRKKKKSSLYPTPKTPLESLLYEHLDWLRVKHYSENTVTTRHNEIMWFLSWCAERDLIEPTEITRPILERYQRHLFYYRKKNGEPLSFRSQHARLVPLRVWFRWMTRQNYILHNPASELELPRQGHHLPKHVLNIHEVEQVLQQPDIGDTIGLRDRAILETLYSTGMRRMEIAVLKLYDVDHDSGTVLIRQGKGRKDRVVPIGERALMWMQKYLREARPKLAAEPDDATVFLTNAGEEISLEHLSDLVAFYVDQAQIGKTGSSHLLRHTMATLMLEGGADIRYIQHMLGHASLSTTEIYTHVAIRMLKQIHTATHPGAQLERKKEPAAQESNETEAARVELLETLNAEAEEEEARQVKEKPKPGQ
jgi:integrase/recombinase XerD